MPKVIGEEKRITERTNEQILNEIAEIDKQLEEYGKPVCNDGKAVIRKMAVACSAADLEEMELPPIRFIVQDILTVGLAIVCAPPKSFKSFMVLDLLACVASGRPFLGFKTDQCGTLYYDLESGLRRPKERLKTILQGKPFPKSLYIITAEQQVGTIETGFLDDLEYQLNEHPDIKLVAVDVFQKIRGTRKRTQNAYEGDYSELQLLQNFAVNHKICLLLVHHTNRGKHDDMYEAINGSNGIMGSVDIVWMIQKERNSKSAILHITGRDIRSEDYSIEFHDHSCTWEMLGDSQTIEDQRLLDEYNKSPITKTIKGLLSQNGDFWEGSAGDLQKVGKYFNGGCSVGDSRQIGRFIQEHKYLYEAVDGISIMYKRTGSDGKRIYQINKN